MVRSRSLVAAGLLIRCLSSTAAITVDLLETLQIFEAFAEGEYDGTLSDGELEEFGGVDPLDADCPSAGRCIGLLTRDGSLESDSRYGCTEPIGATMDDDFRTRRVCNVFYSLSESSDLPVKISSVNIALHPDSVSEFSVYIDDEDDVFQQWQAAPGTTELQEISILRDLEISSFRIEGVMEVGEYLGIMEMEIYVDVDEVVATGASASTRTSISATATTDAESAINTLDGDATTDASSWTCSAGEVCEITYDLEAVESLQQLRIGFSEGSDTGGTLNFMTAGESGEFSTVRTGIEAGGRPVGSDGLQTFGGVRALARYVKIGAVPASGGVIGITEVEFRVGEDAPERPVTEKAWLKPTGMLPIASDPSTSQPPNYDLRMASDGGCDSPAPFEGCHVYYVKDGDMDSRWSCGPLAIGSRFFSYEDCDLDFSLNNFRYVRQIQLAFHMGDEQHNEFTIEANTVLGWVTVVPSAITSGSTTDYQTFDVSVHANLIRVVPVFQNYNQWIGIKEMIILERRKNDFVAGTVPVFGFRENFANDDDDASVEIQTPTRFKFDIPAEGDSLRFIVSDSTITAVRMKFPADREFVFNIEYDVEDDAITEEFTSAGGERTWETFTLSIPATEVEDLTVIAVSGPSFVNVPMYPTLRVVDFQIVGEPLARAPGYFEMVSTTIDVWDIIPDIIGDGVSEQEEIMTAICETKGATYDGTDCVGELDDSTVFINIKPGDYFVDGPIFVKSGVTLSGQFSDESPSFAFFFLYNGPNNGNTAEDGMIVIDGVTDAEVEDIYLGGNTDTTGDIVPGTLGNLALDVRNSQDLRFSFMSLRDTRTGAARFVDSKNISSFVFFAGAYETGNFMDLVRVEDFEIFGIPAMRGLLLEDCQDIYLRGIDESGIPNPELHPSSSGDQTASVVITGDSSGIVFQDLEIGVGEEPRIQMGSTEPLTLDNIVDYEDAVSGDCIIEVLEGTTEDLIVQVNPDQTLSKSGNCWVLD